MQWRCAAHTMPRCSLFLPVLYGLHLRPSEMTLSQTVLPYLSLLSACA